MRQRKQAGSDGDTGSGSGSGSKNQTVPVLPGWMTCAEACARLGIGDRALRLAVARGEVLRSQAGRTVRYRIIRPLPVLPDDFRPLPVTEPRALPVLPVTLPDGTAELVERLSRLAQDLGEALGIASMLADDRDRLHQELDCLRLEVDRLHLEHAQMRAGLANLATSPAGWFARKRIIELLAHSERL